MKDRVTWLDLLRGGAMLIVVLGHTSGAPNGIIQFFKPIEIPLFIFISGCLYKMMPFKVMIKKSLCGLIIPYWIMSTIISILLTGEVWRHIATHDLQYLINRFLNIMLGRTFWFIPCLIVIQLLFWVIRKLFAHGWCVLCIAISLLSMFLFNGLRCNLPYHIDNALMLLGYFAIGNFYYHNQQRFSAKKQFLLWLPAVYGICVYWHLTAEKIVWNASTNDFGNIFVFALASITGIVMLVEAGKRIKEIKLVNLVGRNTFQVYFWQDRTVALCAKIFPDVLWGAKWVMAVAIATAVGIGFKKCFPFTVKLSLKG